MSDKISEIIRSISELSDGDFAESMGIYISQVNYHHPLVPQTVKKINHEGRIGLRALDVIKELQGLVGGDQQLDQIAIPPVNRKLTDAEQEMVMSDKIQITTNGQERPEWLNSDSKQILGDINITLNCGDNVELDDSTRQYTTSFISDWQDMKDAFNESVSKKRRLTDAEQIAEIKSDPELAEKMISSGLDIPYAKDRFCYLWWSQQGYKITLVDYEPFSKTEQLFDNVDDFKTEFLKLKPRNPNSDWDDIFRYFMLSIADVKKHFNID